MGNAHAKWPLAGVLTGLVILTSGTTPGEAHGGRRFAPIERRALGEQLGLTADQVQAIREIRTRNWEAMRATVEALREGRRALREMALGQVDEAAFAAKAAEVRELAGQVLEWRARALRELAAVLTPEQRAKLRELRRTLWERRPPLAG